MKSDIEPITDYVIQALFPLGNENNRNRGIQLHMSGSAMHGSLNYTKCVSRLDENLNTFSFKMNVTPSMKTKVKKTSIDPIGDKLCEHYTVFVAFDLITKQLLLHPCTVCECYDGRHVCSHIL